MGEVLHEELRFINRQIGAIDDAIDRLTFISYVSHRDRGYEAERLGQLYPEWQRYEVAYQAYLAGGEL